MMTPLRTERHHPLHEQLKNTFDLKETYVEFEIFDNVGEEYYANFKTKLKNHPNYESIKHKYFFDDPSYSFLKIFNAKPWAEYDGISDGRRDFYPICSKAEIIRIFEPKNNQDYLLQYRASRVMSSSRLKKTFYKLMDVAGADWNFESFFASHLFDEYMDLLPALKREQCSSVVGGFANSDSANGYCIKVPSGSIVVVSAALKHFLYYMNLFHNSDSFEMEEAGFQSFLIAIRTMLGTETFDFEADSRGEVPAEFHELLEEKTNDQLLFIIGHEYAHHYLGHLHSGHLVNAIADVNTQFENKFYSYSQRAEFEADIASITAPDVIEVYRKTLTQCACDFFFYVDLFQAVQEYIFPSASSYKTHPSPLDRIANLNQTFPTYLNSEDYQLENAMKYFQDLKASMLTEFLPFNIEGLEQYGSVYLNPALVRNKIDHIDY